MITTLLPLLAIFVMAAVHYLLNFLGLFAISWVTTLFWAVASFGFGMVLNDKPKRSQGWVLKLIIAFIVFLLFVYQMNWISLPILRIFSSNLYIYFIYVWCGWAFFRNL